MRLRGVGTFALAASAMLVKAQTTGIVFVARSLTLLQSRGILPYPSTGNPLMPRGHPSPHAKFRLQPRKGGFSQAFKLIKADHYGQIHGRVRVLGNVVFEYHGYQVKAAKAEGDDATQVFVIQGQASIQGADAVIYGDRIVIDFRSGAFQAFRSDSDIGPKLAGGNLKADVYERSQETHGNATQTFDTNGRITTCDLDDPHYDLEAEGIDVRYGVRAILRRARLYLFSHEVASVPFLVVPLEDRNYNNLPQIGYDDYEGYFIKTRYGFPLPNDRYVLGHFDYMSKLGVGLGGDMAYKAKLDVGTVSLYTISGPWHELLESNEHKEAFKFGTLDFSNQYSNNDYQASPGEITDNLRASLLMPQGTKGNTQLSLTRNYSQTSYFSSLDENFGLNDDRRWNSSFHTSLNVNYSDSDSSYSQAASTQRSEADVHMQAQDEINKATLGLEYLRNIPIGSAANFYSGGDKTPEVSIASDAQRLFGRSFATALPFQTSLAWGDYSAGIPGQGDIGRYSFDFAFQKPDNRSKPLTLSYNGDFKQELYSDNTAQYVLNFGTDLKYKLSNDNSTDLRYSYIRPYGYTPLSVDYTGITNLITLDTTAKPLKELTTGIQTGYDITRLETKDIPWQQVGLRNEYAVGNYFSLRGLETYDTFAQEWSNVRLDLTYKPGATTFAVGSRYDAEQKVWTSVTVSLVHLKIGRTLLSALLSYNGYTSRFDSEQYNVIYDLHCAEAVLNYSEFNYGFQPGRTVEFFIRLKALPFDSNFGLGHRGQPITTSTGLDF